MWLALTREQVHPLSYQTYGRITLGMTRAEVESILGGPPRVVGAKPKFVSFAPTEQEGEIGPHGIIVGERAEWYGDRGRIVVGFDTSGRVKAKQYYRPLTP